MSVKNRSKRRDRPAWYVIYRDVDGRRTKAHTRQPTKALAEAFEAQVKARVARGLVGIPELPGEEEAAKKRMTVRQLGGRFTAEYDSPRVKDLRRYRKVAEYLFEKHLYPALGGVRVAAL